ncbi:hypothetical protein AB0G76_36925 [Streptomyces asoensis]|uniref:hypothetical protein n=1 Tax=Streptomyces asoensis TaxID=249586 RepID=UPI0033E7B868
MGAVTDAINAEIEKLRVEDVAPGLAELATSLARSVDEADAPTAKAVAARELRVLMSDLRKLAPVGEEGDGVDGIIGGRAERKSKLRAVPASGE